MSIKNTETAKSGAMRNPYIMNFCKVLVEQKGGSHEPAVLRKLLDDMYRLFECMLGQSMIKALPEPLRAEYLSMTDDLQKLSYDKIEEVFDKSIPDYEKIMKETMREFAGIFLKNSDFCVEDYPVPLEALKS